jgi:septal ring factor EnvC (AmiA/AmiB activator)
LRTKPALAVAVVGLALWPALAAPPAGDERVKRVRERRLALERELKALRGEEQGLLGELERLELEVRLREAEAREIQLVLERANSELDATLRRVGELERSIEQTRPLLAARSRALYKLGELSYLRMLLSVDRPSDMLRGYRYVAALARRDRERLQSFREDLLQRAAARDELEAKTREALALRANLDKARRRLEADRARKSERLTELVARKEVQAAYAEELEQAEARLQQMIQGFGEGELRVPVEAFRGSLAWPAAGKLRSGFGRRRHPRFDTYTVQNGIEIDAAADSPVTAVHEGTVVFAERFRGYGLMVVLDHGDRHHSLYARLGELRVEPGQKLAAGELLGTVGASGADGGGLYFEIRAQGRPEDPLLWLRRAGS